MKYPSLHVFSHGNFGAEKTHGNTLKMVPNVPPIFPYCFPCVKWSPSHVFSWSCQWQKKIWNFWLQAPQAITLPFEAPQRAITLPLRQRRVTTWPPSQAIVISWRDFTYQVMMLLFVTSTKGDNPRYIRWCKFSLCHLDWCRISMICAWMLDAKRLASHLLRDLKLIFPFKRKCWHSWDQKCRHFDLG